MAQIQKSCKVNFRRIKPPKSFNSNNEIIVEIISKVVMVFHKLIIYNRIDKKCFGPTKPTKFQPFTQPICLWL